MIDYRHPEEEIVAIHFASLFKDSLAKSTLQAKKVSSPQEARHLSQSFQWMGVQNTGLKNSSTRLVATLKTQVMKTYGMMSLIKHRTW